MTLPCSPPLAAALLALTAASATAQPQPQPQPTLASSATPVQLDLTCAGEGRAKRTVTFGTIKMKPGQLPKAPPSFTGDISFKGEARVRIREGGKSEILLPRQLLSDGKFQTNGYKEVRNVAISEDTIEGKVAISLVYQPKLRIDRRTGELTVAGSQNSYNASCEANSTDRKF